MQKPASWQQYDIMHMEQKVASICRDGRCFLYDVKMLPYNLYLEQLEDDDIEIRVQNLDNFYHWCASRVLTLDRTYAKEILNSIGATQAATDKDRAQIALSYHALSLMDVYWTKEADESVAYSDINLYDNQLETAFVDVSLRGKQITIQNRHLVAEDLSTQGCFPKAWIRKEDSFYLMKDGSEEAVERELLASKICQCFRVNQIAYEATNYDGQKVSASRLLTSLEYSIVPMEYFEIYCVNQDKTGEEAVLALDSYSYYMMNIVDYLIGNTDRHWGNWGVLVDNQTNEPVRLYDLMDFNRAFEAYDTLDGAKCLTTTKNQNQREAAIEAVKKVGLNQIREIDEKWFWEEAQKEMFWKRLLLLREQAV